MNKLAPLALILAISLTPACASRRLLVVENTLLHQQNTELQKQVAELQKAAPNAADYVRHPNLDTADTFLTRAGYVHSLVNTGGSPHIRMDYAGRNTSFSVTVQYFASRDVMFVATSGYLKLDEAQNTESIVLLLVQLSTLNYDMLLGKFQLNPETGEILLSAELRCNDGLTYQTFLAAVDDLCQQGDSHYADLQKAMQGLGI